MNRTEHSAERDADEVPDTVELRVSRIWELMASARLTHDELEVLILCGDEAACRVLGQKAEAMKLEQLLPLLPNEVESIARFGLSPDLIDVLLEREPEQLLPAKSLWSQLDFLYDEEGNKKSRLPYYSQCSLLRSKLEESIPSLYQPKTIGWSAAWGIYHVAIGYKPDHRGRDLFYSARRVLEYQGSPDAQETLRQRVCRILGSHLRRVEHAVLSARLRVALHLPEIYRIEIEHYGLLIPSEKEEQKVYEQVRKSYNARIQDLRERRLPDELLAYVDQEVGSLEDRMAQKFWQRRMSPEEAAKNNAARLKLILRLESIHPENLTSAERQLQFRIFERLEA